MQTIIDSFLSNPEYYIAGAFTIAEAIRRAIKTKDPRNLIQLIGAGLEAVFDKAKIKNGAK